MWLDDKFYDKSKLDNKETLDDFFLYVLLLINGFKYKVTRFQSKRRLRSAIPIANETKSQALTWHPKLNHTLNTA